MGTGPHDALFRATFSNAEDAAAELRAVLPPALRTSIDFTTLRLAPGSYLDDELNVSHSDLLFSVELGQQRALLYLLFEHQSTVDELMPFRMLKYVVRVLDRHIRSLESPRLALPLPLVLPVLLHHSETGWTAHRDLHELFDDSLVRRAGIAPYVPRLSFILDDISHITDEELAARAMGWLPTLTLWALRDARRPPRLLTSLGRWASVMRAMAAAETGREALMTIFRYLTLVVPDLTPEALHGTLASLAPEVEQIVMTTLAERWKAEGEARGRAEGEIEGARGVLLRQLTLKFGALSTDHQERVLRADADTVQRWSLRILTAGSLGELLE